MTSFHFQSLLSGIFVGCALVLLVWEWAHRQSLRWFVLFRVLWILGIAFLLGNLQWVTSSVLSEPETLRVYVDRSDSVSKVPQHQERRDRFLRELKKWSEDSHVSVAVSSFAESSREEPSGELSSSGGLLSLINPLEPLWNGGDTGAQILVSDGLWMDQAVAHRPLITLSLGAPVEKDLWIENIQPVYTAFLKNRLKIPVHIGQVGARGSKVQVSLRRGRDLVMEQEVTLSEGGADAEFSLFPERMGETTFFVSVRPIEGELSTLNNEIPFRVRTVRDKIRILHIGGKPNVDLKTWRLFLTRQPDVDLVSFYILRSLTDVPEAKQNELSLIPFPYEELFSTELEKFDVVILQNFDFNLYFYPSYLSNLSRFIDRGGALMMIGGDQSFHRYRGSPIESQLPFSFAGDRGLFEDTKESMVMGEPSPITEGLAPLLSLIPFTARHRVHSEPQAHDLLKTTSGIPVLSVRQVKEGRIVSLNTDEFSRISSVPTSDGARAFGRVARRLLQYLTFDPDLEGVRIESRGRWRTQEKVSLSLPSKVVTSWSIQRLGPDSSQLTTKDIEVQNASSVDFVIPIPGIYSVKSAALKDPVLFETEEQPWRGEWQRAAVDFEKLKRLAETSGGKYFDFENREKMFDISLTGRQTVAEEIKPWSHFSSWVSGSVLIFILLLLFLDFFFRKKHQWDL